MELFKWSINLECRLVSSRYSMMKRSSLTMSIVTPRRKWFTISRATPRKVKCNFVSVWKENDNETRTAHSKHWPDIQLLSLQFDYSLPDRVLFESAKKKNIEWSYAFELSYLIDFQGIDKVPNIFITNLVAQKHQLEESLWTILQLTETTRWSLTRLIFSASLMSWTPSSRIRLNSRSSETSACEQWG